MKGQQETNRKQNALRKSHQIAIEIAESGAAILDYECADKGHGHDKAGSGRGEHRKGDCRHLAEIGQRSSHRLTLPVGVGDEADGGIECQNPLHPREPQRVQRQVIWKTDQVDEDRHKKVGCQYMESVGLPFHWLAYGLPADQTMGDFVDGMVERIEPGLPIHHDVREIASVFYARRRQVAKRLAKAAYLKTLKT